MEDEKFDILTELVERKAKNSPSVSIEYRNFLALLQDTSKIYDERRKKRAEYEERKANEEVAQSQRSESNS